MILLKLQRSMQMKHRKLAQKYRVVSIPTLLVFKNGEETNRSIGVISKQEILDLL